MFSFFAKKSTLQGAGFMRGMRDCHSHILPGVDDGVQSAERSLEILSWYEQQGVREVIFTPHIMECYPRNNESSLREEFSKLQGSYRGSLELSLGAEYMLDSSFREHLKRGEMLTLKDNYLLVEMSFISAPINLMQTLCDIMSQGYFVVLAHPERYLFLEEGEYAALKDEGVLFQLNIASLLGGYGRSVSERALKLLKQGRYNLLGSDMHSLKSYQGVISQQRLPLSIIEQLERLKDWR